MLTGSLNVNEIHFLTLGTTSESGTSLSSTFCFLAAGSFSSAGAEGVVHWWELRFWQAAGGTAVCSSALLFPTSTALGRVSLRLFSCRLPHSIKRDEDGRHRKGWLGSRAGFSFSVLVSAGVEGCRARLLMLFRNERLGTSV